MESIQYFIYNLYNKYNSFKSDELFIYSINSQLQKIDVKLKELDYQIVKKKNELSLYQKNFDEEEVNYNNSKMNLFEHNKLINIKINLLNTKFEGIYNTSRDVLYKSQSINEIFNEFKNNNNIDIFQEYTNFNKIIENNVLKCEISKEKLQAVKNELNILEISKSNFLKKINQLNELNKSLELTNTSTNLSTNLSTSE
jgi:hypothetical protein